MRHGQAWALGLLIWAAPAWGRQGDDPVASRLLLAPTGRPLARGEGYFSDYELFFPAVTYGLTGNLSVSAGASLVPGLGLQEQLFYVSPRLAWSLSDKAAAAIGVFYARTEGENAAAAVAYGVGTFGGPDASLTIGLGFGALDEGRWRIHKVPGFMVGGSKRLSPRLALITETWVAPRRGYQLSEQPFGLGLRFLGDRLSVDLGFIGTAAALDEGLPLPWLSFTYRFPGPSRP